MTALLAVGAWFAVLLFVLSLCRAAKLSDDATDDAFAQAGATSLERSSM